MPGITAHIIPAQGQTADDVLAAVLGTQHERALITGASAHPSNYLGIVRIAITYDLCVAEGEIEDCADRIRNMTGVMGVDTVRITR